MKKYSVKFPTYLGLNPENPHFAKETPKGYRIKVSDYQWIGLPKAVVENNPNLFEFIGEFESQKSVEKEKRTRVKPRPTKVSI